MISMKDRADRLNQVLKNKKAAFRVCYKQTWKNNIVNDCYILQADNHNCCPVVYADDWYDLPDAEAANYLIRIFRACACTVDIDPIIDADYIRSRILPRVVSADNIPAIVQQGIAYDTYLDLAVLYYLPVDFGDGATVQITNRLLEASGMTKAEAAEYAKQNLASAVEITRLSDILKEIDNIEEANDSIYTFDTDTFDINMFVLTTSSRVYGAAVILLGEQLFENLENQMQCKLAYLPSSTHELIAVPYRSRKDLQDYLTMVHIVNDSTVAAEERLRENVYYMDNGHLQALLPAN